MKLFSLSMQSMKAFKALLLLGLLFSFGCQSSLSPSEYVKWVSDSENGLRRVKQIGSVKMELQYKPIPYVIANELRSNHIDRTAFEERYTALEGGQYFTMKISIDEPGQDITKYGIRDMNEQQERLYYLSYAMQNDIHLLQGSDTLACKLYHFERSYDLTPHRTFVLAFDEKESPDLNDKTFIWDTPLFGTGPIKVKFRSESLEEIPNMKIDG
ncbi:MAG: hypothetical protein AAFP19_18690 [Bacteroidota bacterium]